MSTLGVDKSKTKRPPSRKGGNLTPVSFMVATEKLLVFSDVRDFLESYFIDSDCG